MTIEWLYFALIGSVAGFFGGLLGIGGGSITVPLLFFALQPLGLSDTDLMHVVLGTSFAAMVFNTIASTFFHHQKGYLPWKIVTPLVPAIVLGPLLGSFIATLLEGDVLRFSFGLFQIAIAIYFFLPKHKKVEIVDKKPHPAILNSVAFVIGGVGSILGIGGGIIMVPFLDMMGMTMKKAIATSAFTSCITLLVSAISFLVLGLKNPISIPSHIGFIYLPAFVIIAIFAMLTSPLGVRVVHKLPILPLKRVFAIALALLGLLIIAG